jgi:hypothetical protein
VRFLLGDTKSTQQQLQDEEIFFAISQRASVWGACATCCEALSSQFSREADSVQGQERTMYSAKAKAYNQRARFYDMKAAASGGFSGYAGGISVADKTRQEENPDRVAPNFNIGMTDNSIPVAQAGNEYPETQGAGDVGQI